MISLVKYCEKLLDTFVIQEVRCLCDLNEICYEVVSKSIQKTDIGNLNKYYIFVERFVEAKLTKDHLTVEELIARNKDIPRCKVSKTEARKLRLELLNDLVQNTKDAA